MTTQILKNFSALHNMLIEPFLRIFTGPNKAEEINKLLKAIITPLVALGIFLLLWSAGASQIKTKLSALRCFKSQWISMVLLIWSVYFRAIVSGRQAKCRF